VTGRYRTTLTGPFPRTEALVQATRDLDRKRIPPERAEEVFREAEAAVADVERNLALDSVTGGYLRWPDLFRPFTQIWGGVSAGTLTRFFETNTFFRQPVMESRPQPGRGRLADWLPRGPTARAVLPGPYTFSHLAEIRYAPDGGSGALRDIADALAAELLALGSDRPPFVQFQEPLLAYDPPKTPDPELATAYRILADACPGATTFVWTYFGDAGAALPTLSSLPVDVVGFDLFGSTIPRASAWQGRGIGLGCIDPTSTIGEEPADVARLVRGVEGSLSPSSVWLGPNPPLDLLPFDSAVAKLKLLPALRAVLEG
jgi:5-methyltetrahydropteroyltriglutamate--homocysteine methyltransferase